MGRQVETLAGFIAGTRFEDIPERVRQHAKLVVLDTLGVMLAGSQRPEVKQLRTALLTVPGDGPSGPSTAYAMGFPS